jgi:hypothetical protein
MNNVASPGLPGSRLGRAARVLGLGVCALLILGACGTKDREFGEGGGGNVGTGGSIVTGGTGGTGTSGSTSSSSSTGGTSGSTTSSSSTSSTGCHTVDPDCECVNEVVVARDTDMDGHGSRLCEESPGDDCDDGDPNFVFNECGGCNKNLGGKVGDPCLQCGAFACMGDSALQCVTPTPAPKQCSGTKVIQVCQNGMWVNQTTCTGALPACLNAKCVECKPGTHKCGTVVGTPVSISCLSTGSWESSWTSCGSSSTCSSSTGMCVELFHPRDLDFNVPRLLRDELGAPPPGMRTRDVLDLAVGIAFG